MLSLVDSQLATPAPPPPPPSQWVNTLPSVDDLLCTLRRCCVKKDFSHARLLHVHVCEIGLEAHEALGNHLVPMLVDCGSLGTAQQVFNQVNLANEHSWTSLIQGYAELGELEHALDIYTQMQEDCLQLNSHIFIALLKASSLSNCLDCGYQLHLEIVKEEFCDDLYVANTLVDMYAKHGCILESKDVLDEMALRDVVSWTALMAAYNENGYHEEALQCLNEMQEDRVQPNAVSLVSALKACSTLGYNEKGQELYAEVVRKGFEEDSFVANTLVDLYGSCGFIPDALYVFDKLENKDAVSWNALITGYSKNRLEEDALLCAERMESQGVCPLPITFTLTLKVCVSKGALGNGRVLHANAVKRGFEKLPSICNSLVDMYSKCGAIPESQDVFDSMQARGNVSWNLLMNGYAERGFYEETLNCLEKMQVDGVCPDAISFVCALHVCGCMRTIHRGHSTHMKLIKLGLEGDRTIANTLVDMYAKVGLLSDSKKTFDKIPTQEVVSWNTLIAGYVDSGHDVESLGCLEQMQNEGVCPDFITFVCCLKACGRLGCLNVGQKVHIEAVKKGFEKDLFLGCSLVDMYAKCGFLEDASGILEDLHNLDVVSWTALISGYANQGLCESALNYFQKMQRENVAPDVASWNAVISGYAEEDEPAFALQLYAQMLDQALLPSTTTFISIFKACGNMVTSSFGLRFHAITYVLDTGETNLDHALIDMYIKCGSIADAQRVFKIMPFKNLSSWNALITARAQCGDYNSVLLLLEGIKRTNLQPDEITFLGLLSVCSHVGLVAEGMDYFLTSIEQHDMIWSIKHISCMIDLLTRAGHFQEALGVVETMPFEPDYALWCTLLDTCRRWGNIRLGKQMFESAVRLDRKHDAVYILMFNMYMDAHMWEEATAIEELFLNLQGLEGIVKSNIEVFGTWHESFS